MSLCSLSSGRRRVRVGLRPAAVVLDVLLADGVFLQLALQRVRVHAGVLRGGRLCAPGRAAAINTWTATPACTAASACASRRIVDSFFKICLKKDEVVFVYCYSPVLLKIIKKKILEYLM